MHHEQDETKRLDQSEHPVYRINNLPAEIAKAIKAAKMNSSCDHLNALLDDEQQALCDLEFLIKQLSELYEPAEICMWLHSQQKSLGEATPAELIQQGKIQELIALVERLRDGVHV